MSMSLDQLKSKWLSDPEVAKEYHSLDINKQLASQVIELRRRKRLTQAQLSELMETKQSSISRLENMESLPSLSFLIKLAEVLNANIEIKLSPKQ